ncbi:acetamidase/formamidase family protein [Candidatus Hydrogenedentota bacterium]
MQHLLEPAIENLHGSWAAERKPILIVASGDTIIAKTRSGGWGQGAPERPDILPKRIKKSDRMDPENDIGCCLVGPIAIQGARPGMVLKVEIEELVVGEYGLCVTGKNPFGAYESKGVDDTFGWMPWVYDKEKGTATNLLGHTVKLRPFLGTLGVAPAAPGHHSNLPPRKCGGNIDCKELIAGSTLYLPIEVPEALFSFGDGHALQGDGEIGDSAIECPMERVRLTVSLRDDMNIQHPFAETQSGWLSFGFHEDLKEAMFIALNGMLDFIMTKLDISRKEALMLASLTVDLRITQAVNPVTGVHAFWPFEAISGQKKRDGFLSRDA